MKIGRQPNTIKINVDGEILQQVEELKYLGSILHHLDTQKRISVLE